jgi:pimeloyl-ACP methyl ester carboxylesterase
MSFSPASPEIRFQPPDSRPLALLIPGLDGTGRFFEFQLEALSHRFRALPWAYPRRAGFSFEDLVRDLGEATASEPAGSVTVVGESFGGAVALHFVLAFPARIHRLGLINTFCHYDRRIRITLGYWLSPLLLWRGIRGLKNFVGDSLLAAEGISTDGRRLYREVVARVDPVAYRRRLQLVREVDLRGLLPGISVPTVILVSGRDKVVPSVSSAAFMASRISGARVFEFPDAGHALLLTPGFCLADYL